MIVVARELGKRMMIVFSGEALQSAFHFGLNIALVHTLPADNYGSFALTMIIGGIGLTYVRALAAMPASICIGSSRNLRHANVYDVTFGSGAFVVAVAIGLIAALLLWDWLGATALAGGGFVGIWSLRSYVRIATFARHEPMPALGGDVVFTLSGALLTGVMLSVGTGDELLYAFILLLVANSLGTATTLIAGRRLIRVTLRRNIRRRFAAIGRQLWWSGLGVTVSNLQGQGFAFVVATMAGPAAYAPIAAILLLFVPLRLLAFAVANALQPDLAAHLARGERPLLWQRAKIWTFAIGTGVLAYGGAVIVGLPWFHPAVLRGAPIHLICAVIWAITASFMLYLLPRLILEACGALRGIAIISTVSAVVGICTPAAILTIAAPVWSLLGALASEQIVLIGSWIYLRRVAMAAGTSPISLWNVEQLEVRAGGPLR